MAIVGLAWSHGASEPFRLLQSKPRRFAFSRDPIERNAISTLFCYGNKTACFKALGRANARSLYVA
jgi:hypothetical protein